MWLVYLIALMLGGGLIVVQLLIGGGHDVDHGLALAHASAGHGSALLSPRSITYALAAFGLVGAPLHFLRVLSPFPVFGLAVVAGVAAAAAARFAVRSLDDAGASGAVSLDDLVGYEARVLIDCGRDRSGKVRLTVGGQIVDLLATTNEEQIAADATVWVAEVRDGVAHVVSPTKEKS